MASPITKEKVREFTHKWARLLFFYIISFAVMDIVTTYWGVCELDGAELNSQAAAMVMAVGGLLNWAPIHVGLWGLVAFMFFRYVVKAKNTNLKLLYIVPFFFIAIYYALIIVNNLDALQSQFTGFSFTNGAIAKDFVRNAEEGEIQSIMTSFEPNRDVFCGR